MKREDLEKLELSKEAIDQIMALNGKDIEAGKGRLTAAEQERDALKTQLTEANKQIESFKAMDVEAIKKSADEYKAKFEQAEADAKAKMDQLKFDHALDGALTEAKAKSAKAVKALINVEGLKLTDDGSIVGLKEQLEKIKSENDYLFESETKPDGPEHYVNREIILNDEIDRQAVKFLIDDNCFLEPDYVAAVKKEYSGVFYDRFIRGEFVRAEGLIFPDFAGDPGRWILDRVPEDLRYVTYGVDFGGNKSKTVFIACGIRKGRAGVVVLDAYRVDGDGITPDRVEREFVAFVKRTAARFPSLRQTYAFTDEPQYLCNGLARAVRAAGLPLTVTLAKKEEIKTRIYAKSKLMATGRWAILKGCPLVGYATANQVWDAKKSEDVRLDVEPAVNDVADAEEYAWAAFMEELGGM